MPTHSTKSRTRKSVVSESSASIRNSGPVLSRCEHTLSPRVFHVSSVAILLASALLRLLQLDLRPLHHDEGVNGLFLVRLLREGVYQYDPANYHGPVLYYCALALARLKHLFGARLDLGVAGLRLTPALFSIATTWLVLLLRRWIGDRAALFAGAFIALSPCAVYFGRDFIHESVLVFFNLALVVSVLRYAESRRPLHLFLISVSAALMFAAKETAVISVAALLLAWVLSIIWIDHRKPHILRSALSSIHLPPWPLLAASVLLFFLLFVLFFSSFFSNMHGIRDALVTFRLWQHTSTISNRHPWYSYLTWMAVPDLAILSIGTVGFLTNLWRARGRFAVFAGFWAVGVLAVYSLLPYKTPWLALNIVVPFGIVAGLGFDILFGASGKLRSSFLPRVVVALTLLLAIWTAYQSLQLNWLRFDSQSHPYVYAQTPRAFLSLIDQINSSTARFGTGTSTSITVTSREYWPLPWYLRDYPRAGYYGHIIVPNEQLVIASEMQEPYLLPLLGSRYLRAGTYPLRPGVNLIMYVRQ